MPPEPRDSPFPGGWPDPESEEGMRMISKLSPEQLRQMSRALGKAARAKNAPNVAAKTSARLNTRTLADKVAANKLITAPLTLRRKTTQAHADRAMIKLTTWWQEDSPEESQLRDPGPDEVVKFAAHFITLIDKRSSRTHAISGTSVNTFRRYISYIKKNLAFDDPEWKWTNHHQLRLDNIITQLLQSKQLYEGVLETRQRVGSLKILEMVSTAVYRARTHGCANWQRNFYSCLLVIILLATAARSGDITRSADYEGAEYLQWGHIQITLKPGSRSLDDSSMTIRLVCTKGRKTRIDEDVKFTFSSQSTSGTGLFNPIAWVYGYGFRTGNVGGLAYEDELLRASESLDGRIMWVFPDRPVFHAWRHLCPQGVPFADGQARYPGIFGWQPVYDTPISGEQLRNCVRAVATGIGLTGVTPHAIRRGVASEVVLHHDDAADPNRARLVLGHSSRSAHGGVTERYTGIATNNELAPRLDHVLNLGPRQTHPSDQYVLLEPVSYQPARGPWDGRPAIKKKPASSIDNSSPSLAMPRVPVPVYGYSVSASVPARLANGPEDTAPSAALPNAIASFPSGGSNIVNLEVDFDFDFDLDVNIDDDFLNFDMNFEGGSSEFQSWTEGEFMDFSSMLEGGSLGFDHGMADGSPGFDGAMGDGFSDLWHGLCSTDQTSPSDAAIPFPIFDRRSGSERTAGQNGSHAATSCDPLATVYADPVESAFRQEMGSLESVSKFVATHNAHVIPLSPKVLRLGPIPTDELAMRTALYQGGGRDELVVAYVDAARLVPRCPICWGLAHRPRENCMISFHSQPSSAYRLPPTPRTCPFCRQEISSTLRNHPCLIEGAMNLQSTYPAPYMCCRLCDTIWTQLSDMKAITQHFELVHSETRTWAIFDNIIGDLHAGQTLQTKTKMLLFGRAAAHLSELSPTIATSTSIHPPSKANDQEQHALSPALLASCSYPPRKSRRGKGITCPVCRQESVKDWDTHLCVVEGTLAIRYMRPHAGATCGLCMMPALLQPDLGQMLDHFRAQHQLNRVGQYMSAIHRGVSLVGHIGPWCPVCKKTIESFQAHSCLVVGHLRIENLRPFPSSRCRMCAYVFETEESFVNVVEHCRVRHGTVETWGILDSIDGGLAELTKTPDTIPRIPLPQPKKRRKTVTAGTPLDKTTKRNKGSSVARPALAPLSANNSHIIPI